MKKSIPVYEILLPEYTLDKKPDYRKVGKKLDSVIKKHFLGKKVCIRALGSQDHKLSKEELVQKIIEQGTDKYDSNKKGFWHDWEAYKDKGIDLFACYKEVTTKFRFMHEVVSDFYEGALVDRGYSVRVDMLLFYNPDLLEMIPIKYAENDIGEDAWRFSFPEQKRKTLLGVIKID